MIFPPIELPQYIGVRPTNFEMKDILISVIGIYRKKALIQYAIFEKCGCYETAIYFNSLRARIFMISKNYL
jgi:hypothetical protein